MTPTSTHPSSPAPAPAGRSDGPRTHEPATGRDLAHVALVLKSGLVLHGTLVAAGPFRYRLVLSDGAIARVNRSAVVAIVNAPGEPDQLQRS